MEANGLQVSAATSHVKANGNGDKSSIKNPKSEPNGENNRSPTSPTKPDQEIDNMSSCAKPNGVKSRLESSVPPGPSKSASSIKSFKRASNGTTSKSPPLPSGEPHKQEVDKMAIKAGPHGIPNRIKPEKKDMTESTSRGHLKSYPSSKVGVEAWKKSLPKVAKVMNTQAVADHPLKKMEVNPPSKSAFSNVKSLSLSLNMDPQLAVPPIKTIRTVKGLSAPAHKDGPPANLCTQCRAEALEGAVCYIGNDGRVSACTSRNAVRLCKNLRCANNNPEYVASVVATNAGPKKYLVSRRHSLNLGSATAKPHVGYSSDKNGSSSRGGSGCAVFTTPIGDKGHDSDEQEELEDEVASLGDMNEVSPSPQTADNHCAGWKAMYRRTRRASISVLETQGPEVVTLRKQMLQERKNADEWMLDYAIEEALHRLAPAKESRVKALVEAFESINIPQYTASEVGVQP